jgi:hypothetical protein
VTPHKASQRAKERLDLEQTFFGGDPPQPNFTTSSQTDLV